MKEREWLTSNDWLRLWHYALDKEYLTDRKRRLLAVACCRRVSQFISDDCLWKMLEFSERWADGTRRTEQDYEDREALYIEAEAAAGGEQRDGASSLAESAAAWAAAMLGNDDHKVGRAIEAVASVFGFIAVMAAGVVDPAASVWQHPEFVRGSTEDGGAAISPLIREVIGNPFRPVAYDPAWRSPAAVSLARQMYESRDFAAMPQLADALRAAGCEDAAVLEHCRDPDGVHVRGCRVVDLVLGKA